MSRIDDPRPRIRFQPDISAVAEVVRPNHTGLAEWGRGYRAGSPTGYLRDHVARDAPGWFRDLINEIAANGDGRAVAAIRLGGARKQSFWGPAPGCATATECLCLAVEMIAAAQRAALTAAKEALAASKAERLPALNRQLWQVAKYVDGIVIEEITTSDVPDDGRDIGGPSGCFIASPPADWAAGLILAKDGRSLALSAYGWREAHGRGTLYGSACMVACGVEVPETD